MNLVMTDPTKTKSKEGQRLTVAIADADHLRLEELKTKILRVTGKKATTQDLASRWITDGITAKERELERLATQ